MARNLDILRTRKDLCPHPIESTANGGKMTENVAFEVLTLGLFHQFFCVTQSDLSVYTV